MKGWAKKREQSVMGGRFDKGKSDDRMRRKAKKSSGLYR